MFGVDGREYFATIHFIGLVATQVEHFATVDLRHKSVRAQWSFEVNFELHTGQRYVRQFVEQTERQPCEGLQYGFDPIGTVQIVVPGLKSMMLENGFDPNQQLN